MHQGVKRMFERLLALRYIKSQKRHSIFTICSIAVALALMTLLFVGYSTYTGIRRDAAYLEKPYHFKLLKLTEAEFSQLAGNPDFSSCKQVEEPDGTLSAEILLQTYHDDFGLYINTLFPEKYLYSDLNEEFKEDLIDVNYELVYRDELEFSSKYESVKNLAVYFIFILFLVLALRLMIDTAFEISSKERERQYGMLQCIGAAPGQIVRILTFEGLFLSIIGIPAGMLLGTGLSAIALGIVRSSGVAEEFYAPEIVPQLMHLHIKPLLLLLAAVTGLVWVFLSAYQTGMRIIKHPPIETITGRGQKVVKVPKFSPLSFLFGWMGKLAARNNRRQPKSFIITVISLTLSIALFASFSFVLGKSLTAFEKTVDVLGLNYDMSIGIKTDRDDPLSYQQGLELIRSSGYFDIHDYKKYQISFVSDEDGNQFACLLVYFPRETFEKQFEGTVPVTYDELTEQNAYLLMVLDGAGTAEPRRFDSPEPITVDVQSRTLVTDEEYAAMSDEEKKAVKEYAIEDLVTGEKNLKYRYIPEYLPATLNIAGSAPEAAAGEMSAAFQGYLANGNLILLAGSLDMYDNGAYALSGKGSLINEENLEEVIVNLRNEDDYEAARAFVKAQSGSLELVSDFYGELKAMRAAVGALKIGIAFLSVLIGLIALVNMVNILSTGILNRKSELAALQCFGMTKGQLYGMMSIECLQYALTAGVLATVLIEGLMYVMLLYLRHMELDDLYGELLSFTEPLPLIWIGAAVTFAAAILASLIPLHRMQKESLTDQIRAIE